MFLKEIDSTQYDASSVLKSAIEAYGEKLKG